MGRKRRKNFAGQFSHSLFHRCLQPAVWLTALCCLLTGVSLSHGAELYTAPAKLNNGSRISIPIMIDQVQGLAGLKLVITYDKDALKFREGQKTPISQSLMHVVNDQKPGRLVVVMAGATGVGGRDITLINLVFTVLKPTGNPGGVKLDIPEVQLMSDQLKEIPCTVRAKTFVAPF
jgi:hypothetical protein